MVSTLTIAGASATALAFYLTLHILAAGAFVMPSQAYRQVASNAAPPALSCVHPRFSAGRGQILDSSGSAGRQQVAPAWPLPSSVQTPDDRISFGSLPASAPPSATLTPISPRAP